MAYMTAKQIEAEARALIRCADKHGWPIRFSGYSVRDEERVLKAIRAIMARRGLGVEYTNRSSQRRRSK